MGMTVQLIYLLDDCLSERFAYCEVNKNKSELMMLILD
jgi:hypothetical protein